MEGSKQAPTKPIVSRKCTLENYIFDVLIISSSVRDSKEKVARKIQIAGTKRLYSFAKVIAQAFSRVGEKMLFLFDYGDEWRFYIELKEIKKADRLASKPVILESIGKAPLQYPPLEEETDNG